MIDCYSTDMQINELCQAIGSERKRDELRQLVQELNTVLRKVGVCGTRDTGVFSPPDAAQRTHSETQFEGSDLSQIVIYCLI